MQKKDKTKINTFRKEYKKKYCIWWTVKKWTKRHLLSFYFARIAQNYQSQKKLRKGKLVGKEEEKIEKSYKLKV